MSNARVAPQNIEAERSVLGSLLIDQEIIPDVMQILTADDFFRLDHKEIYKVIVELNIANTPVDIVTVSSALADKGIIERVGGIEYLSNIAVSVPTTANVKHYSKLVKEKAINRQLIKAAHDISDKSFDGSNEISELISQAVNSIQEIESMDETKVLPIKDHLVNAFDRLEKLYTIGDKDALKSGFTDLDFKLGSMNKSDLIVIAARPAMGKTAFAVNIAENAAIYHHLPTAIFSLEMDAVQITNRIISSQSMVDGNKIKTGKLLDDSDWNKLAKTLGVISDAPIFIDDNPGTTIYEIRSKCIELKRKYGIKLAIIDYLQLIQGSNKRETRNVEVAEITRAAKLMAKELEIPIILLSQLSRAPEIRADHRPILADLRESGAIEQDADTIMFLYRDEYYNPDTDKKNISEVIIAKNRNGSTGTVELVWLGQYTKFANIQRMAI
ncbi:replicative DNA helicase [Ruminiclostridium cellobioparum]|uniref:replicative DNA helicase n=1 Tax=Ruminiclostridium cellobioparum TaxID=29355 RepID=UPI0028AF9CFC|nr:replicative DNA helicase [Ruminiclostridium cellobioparum]